MELPMVWRQWLARHDRIKDALPAVPLIVIAAAATAAVGKDGWQEPRWHEVVWTTLSCVPLAFRSRWPLGVALFTLAGDLTLMAVASHISPAPGASLIALYTLALLGSRRTAWTVGAASAVAITGVYAATHSESLVAGASLLRLDFAIAATALGRTVRSRRENLAAARERVEHAERTREEEARRRVTEERVRIARDLHDVVAHHITLVNAQAGVAHHLMRANPEQAYEALAHIKDNSRAALDELRATVGLLRQPDDAPGARAPIPRLADLDTLVTGFEASGLSVSVTRTGGPSPLAPATDLTAYRIIQEALTNTHKHASASRASVVLDYGAHSLRVTVTDDGRPGAPKGAGTGHGLIGMHERATAIGGTVTAGPRPEGGFQVVAELPLSLSPAPA
ncbi:histidine kinase [Streptomyces viridochromogenes]|uniref:histidine kinase n=1 Tax=Streptomyces viridochromogenes TaxID=1938 RepID=A0A0J7ZIP5_STRVR|nr:histidine kinase [Streptomyces viridochromogenes]KMS75911.1 histidine kinase [Streptomyces viridochromogenes]KOG07491.1 histidine kinase [Streptomyces viridochromogenes]KOG12632.1 histidine kinase [Streptomyces viridochromogenes]